MRIRATPSLRNSASVRYAVPLVTVVGAAFVTTELHAINAHIPASLVFCAAIFSGWFGGVGPGLVAAVISSVFILFNLIPSPYTVRSLSEEVIRVTIYSIAVFFVAWVSGRQRQTEEQLEQARNKLEETVQDRTAELRRANVELQAEISERKVAEESLQAMEAELAHVSRLTMMGELTASIAHEVNQPLGAIMNYANACRRLLPAHLENRDQIDLALASIAEDAERASNVIARIRALSKKKPPEKVPSDLRALIDEVVAIAKYKMLGRGVSVRVEPGAALPLLRVDRIQIQQVLLNLLINGQEAMEAVPPKDRIIEICARADRSEGKAVVIVTVRDHGTGVNPDDQARLFEAFYSTKAEGIGLGLAISRSIVESHGGGLRLIPTEGAGATFQVLFPAEDPAQA